MHLVVMNNHAASRPGMDRLSNSIYKDGTTERSSSIAGREPIMVCLMRPMIGRLAIIAKVH